MILMVSDLKESTHVSINIPIEVFNKFKRSVKTSSIEDTEKKIIELLIWRSKQLNKIKRIRNSKIKDGTSNFGRPRKEVSDVLLKRLRRKGLSYAEISEKTGIHYSTVYRRLNESNV